MDELNVEIGVKTEKIVRAVMSAIEEVYPGDCLYSPNAKSNHYSIYRKFPRLHLPIFANTMIFGEVFYEALKQAAPENLPAIELKEYITSLPWGGEIPFDPLFPVEIFFATRGKIGEQLKKGFIFDHYLFCRYTHTRLVARIDTTLKAFPNTSMKLDSFLRFIKSLKKHEKSLKKHELDIKIITDLKPEAKILKRFLFDRGLKASKPQIADKREIGDVLVMPTFEGSKSVKLYLFGQPRLTRLVKEKVKRNNSHGEYCEINDVGSIVKFRQIETYLCIQFNDEGLRTKFNEKLAGTKVLSKTAPFLTKTTLPNSDTLQQVVKNFNRATKGLGVDATLDVKSAGKGVVELISILDEHVFH